MYREKIIVLPHQHLRSRSRKVGVITKATHQIIHDMQAALLEWEDSREHEVGVALAAIQIDEAQRIIIIRHDFDNKQDRTFDVFINPTITKYEGTIETDFEGCLSISDIYGKVPRHTKVRIKAQNLKGEELRLKAEGFLARVFQHEIDHTNGVAFVDHIKTKRDAFYKLTNEGKLEPLDYEKDVRNSHIFR